MEVIGYSMVKLCCNNRHKICYYNKGLFLIHCMSFADHLWTCSTISQPGTQAEGASPTWNIAGLIGGGKDKVGRITQ